MSDLRVGAEAHLRARIVDELSTPESEFFLVSTGFGWFWLSEQTLRGSSEDIRVGDCVRNVGSLLESPNDWRVCGLDGDEAWLRSWLPPFRRATAPISHLRRLPLPHRAKAPLPNSALARTPGGDGL